MDDATQMAVLAAAFGGIAVQLLEFLEQAQLPATQRPAFNAVYWISLAVKALLGAGLAFVYVKSDIPLKPILAFNVGASAPLIIRAMAQTAPKLPSQ